MTRNLIDDGVTSIAYYIYVLNDDPFSDQPEIISTPALRHFLDNYGVNASTTTGSTIFDYVHDMDDDQLDMLLDEYLIKECQGNMRYIDESSSPHILTFLLKHDTQGRYARIKTHEIDGKRCTLLEYLRFKNRDNRADVYKSRVRFNMGYMILSLEIHANRHLSLFEMMMDKFKFALSDYNKRQRFQ